jgi:hypothetical protein
MNHQSHAEQRREQVQDRNENERREHRASGQNRAPVLEPHP